jgi:hypothetical protein
MDDTSSAFDPIELVERLAGISDMRQRAFVLAERLAGLSDDEVLETLKLIHEKAGAGNADFLLVYNGLLVSGVLTEALGSERMSVLVTKAQDQGCFELVAVLMDIPPEDDPEFLENPMLDDELREKPLGVRKALARKPDVRMIQRIAKDQDHRVIRNLLNNPRLTEQEVMKIGSTRPTSPRVLEEIYNHPRWITRYSIKKVIVWNPYSPLSLPLRLLTFLSMEDLEEIRDAPRIRETIRREAERLIDKKQGPTTVWELIMDDFVPDRESNDSSEKESGDQ